MASYVDLALILLVAVLAFAFAAVAMRAYREERRALDAGMMRPRRGVRVRLLDDVVVVAAPGEALMHIPTASIHRALYVRDDLRERRTGLADALTVYWGDGSESLRVPQTAEGFRDLLTWAYVHVPFDVRVVEAR